MSKIVILDPTHWCEAYYVSCVQTEIKGVYEFLSDSVQEGRAENGRKAAVGQDVSGCVT